MQPPETVGARRAISALRAAKKPADDLKDLRDEVLDLKKLNREMRKEIADLKKKAESGGQQSVKTEPKAKRKPPGGSKN